MNIVTYRTER